MPKIKMTAVTLERLKPPAAGQADFFDAAFPGLALRVTANGVRSWTYFGRVHGKLKRATLGRYPSMSLADARRKAGEVSDAMQEGVNPAAAKREARSSAARDSFAAVADEWLKRDQAKNRSAGEVERVLNRDVKPAWSGRPIASIKRRDVIELIDSIADRGAVTLARRVHAHLHRLFKWAVGRDIVESNPAADLPKPGEEVKRDRVLSDAELVLVWRATADVDWPFGSIFRLLILTGARKMEIGGLQWSEIGDDAIRLAGDRTKNGEPYVIPLSRQARAVIDELPRVGESEFVFTTTGTTPVSGYSKAHSSIDAAAAKLNGGTAIEPWRIHDLRRTVATGLQKLGVSLQVVEAILGHVSGSRAGVVGIYQRHQFDAEKRQALDAWARHVEALVSGKRAKVVSLPRRVRR